MAERFEIALAQRVGQRQHLQRTRHALHLGIEHEADAAHGFEDAQGRLLAVLLIVAEDDAGGEQDQPAARFPRPAEQGRTGRDGFGTRFPHRWTRRGERRIAASIGERLNSAKDSGVSTGSAGRRRPGS